MGHPQESFVMSLNDAMRLNNTRHILSEYSNRGMIGVVSGYSRVPEWVIRDWVNSPMNIPHQQEVLEIEKALVRMHNDASGNAPELPLSSAE